VTIENAPFHRRLEFARRLRTMTQRDLAKLLDPKAKTHSRIAKLETGVLLPSNRERQRLGEVLGDPLLVTCPLVVYTLPERSSWRRCGNVTVTERTSPH
jgi:transcriptional regulator with XRE-family HTH domain